MSLNINEIKNNPLNAVVISVSDSSTAKVEIKRIVANQRYNKRQQLVSKFQVDTNGKVLKIGDFVQIIPCKRFSKTKSWRVV